MAFLLMPLHNIYNIYLYVFQITIYLYFLLESPKLVLRFLSSDKAVVASITSQQSSEDLSSLQLKVVLVVILMVVVVLMVVVMLMMMTAISFWKHVDLYDGRPGWGQWEYRRNKCQRSRCPNKQIQQTNKLIKYKHGNVRLLVYHKK